MTDGASYVEEVVPCIPAPEVRDGPTNESIRESEHSHLKHFIYKYDQALLSPFKESALFRESSTRDPHQVFPTIRPPFSTMASQARNFFQRFPPAECLALFIATLEILPFGIAGLSNPTAFADGYGLPLQRSLSTPPSLNKRSADGQSSETTAISSTESTKSFDEDQKTKKALVAAIAARNVQNGVLLFTFGLILRDRRSLGVAVAAGLVATLADTFIVKAYGAKDKIAGHSIGIFNSLAIGGSLLYWGRGDSWW